MYSITDFIWKREEPSWSWSYGRFGFI